MTDLVAKPECFTESKYGVVHELLIGQFDMLIYLDPS